MDDGESGAELRAVRLRMRAQGLRADDEGERGEREGRALAPGADGREDQAVGDEEEQSALAGAVGLGDPEIADGGEPDDLSGGGGRPGERGDHRPAPYGGTGAAPDGPGQLWGEEFAQVEGERGEQDGAEHAGEPRAGYPEFAGAARHEAGTEQGDEEREDAGGAEQERGRPGAGGRRLPGRCPGYLADAGHTACRHRRRGRVGGGSGERHGPILAGGQRHSKPRTVGGKAASTLKGVPAGVTGGGRPPTARDRPPRGRSGLDRLAQALAHRIGQCCRVRPCSARPRTRRR